MIRIVLLLVAFLFGCGTVFPPLHADEPVSLKVRDLPEAARHAIAYGNGWKMLTGKAWGAAKTP